MSNLQDTLYIIPARGGSKGIPRKNIIPLNGKPLIQYSIEVAMQVTSPSNICISTDDTEIMEVVKKIGLQIPFKRPAELATDTATTENVIKHAIEYYKNKKGLNYNNVVLLQPTSPFRKKEHLLQAQSLYTQNIDMVVSVKKSKANPYYTLFEENENGHLEKSKDGHFARRQDIPDVWSLNGSIYVINVGSLYKKGFTNFNKILKFQMDEIYSIDIDNHLDLAWAEFILKQNLL